MTDAGGHATVTGYADRTYRPSDPVNRAQMAVYISRSLAGGDANVPTGPASTTFVDVPTDFWAYRYIEYAAAQNVVHGYDGGYYLPDTSVDRAQMAAFIARAIVTPTGDAGLIDYTPPTTATFADVPTGHWAYKYVEYIADDARSIARGYSDGLYHPDVICSRDQMAVYIARAFGLVE